jgi:universal stress protein E
MTIDLMQSQIAADKAATNEEMISFLDGLQLGSFKPEIRVIEGTPQMAVRDCVSELLPDLVVLGTRGRSGVLRFVLGSVAEDLLSWLPVDVLAVPPEPKI